MSEQQTHRLVLLLFVFCLTVTMILLFFVPVFGVLFLLTVVLLCIFYTMCRPAVWQMEKRIFVRAWKRFIAKIAGKTDEQDQNGDVMPEYMLVSINADGGRSYPINKEVFLIGRARKCDCVLSNAQTVSKEHCRIIYRKYSREYYIEDLRSSNGTYLGTRRLEPYTQEKLLENAEMSIGHCRFRFVRKRGG